MKCRFCGKELCHVFVDLGSSPPSNSFLTKDQLNDPEVYYPLRVYVCDQCFLVQIPEHKKSSEIFNESYVYFSSVSATWVAHCEAYVSAIVPRLRLDQSSLVVEIASNDGCLLQCFSQRGIPCFGIEPTASTAKAAQAKGLTIIEDFFGSAMATRMVDKDGPADLVIGNNVLAHVPDVNDFVTGLKTILRPSGTITLEFPHLMRLIENTQFDTIYHEHYSYLSVSAVRQILLKCGLRIYDVEELSTHGGSVRVYVCHDGNVSLCTRKTVEEIIAKENSFGLNDMRTYRSFQGNAEDISADLLWFLLDARRRGKRVAAYGAAAKGNTLLNFCGIRSHIIDFVVDRAPSKQGLFLPGSHIPVVDERMLVETKPDYIVVLPWNLKDEIHAQLEYVRRWGAQFVVAIPSLEVC